MYFYSGDQNLQAPHHLGVKERSIPRERNIAEADLVVTVTDDLENQKRHKEGDPAAINRRAVVIDRAVDHEIET